MKHIFMFYFISFLLIQLNLLYIEKLISNIKSKNTVKTFLLIYIEKYVSPFDAL